MQKIPAIAIFDIGKTNKKLFLFDEDYSIIFERTVQFQEIEDEDGFPCEDIAAVSEWIKQSLVEMLSMEGVMVKALNFSTYGASFVHIDAEGNCVTPLYNYLKPFPEHLKKQFYNRYGGEMLFSMHTSSPVL